MRCYDTVAREYRQCLKLHELYRQWYLQASRCTCSDMEYFRAEAS